VSGVVAAALLLVRTTTPPATIRAMPRVAAVALLVLLSTSTNAQTNAVATRIDRILREVPLIDGHNDLPWQYEERVKNHLAQIDIRQDQSKLAPALHTDIARLRQGRVGAQFWSVYVPATLKGADAVRAVLEQIDVVHRLDELYPETFELARTADDVVRIHRSGKIASLIGVEGGHSIGNSLAVLRQLYATGARCMTITHSENNGWADSATADPIHGGLTPFGKLVIAEMNRLGMLVDLSHVAPKTMHDILDVAVAPAIFSHSSARAITDHSRNVPDDVLRRVKENDGVVMVSWVPGFSSEKVRARDAAKDAEEARLKALYRGQPEKVKAVLAQWEAANPAPRATVQDIADHIDHIVQVAGEAHVGLGADLDGITTTPEGLDSVAAYPSVFAELIRRGYTDEELKGIAGLNVLRVMRKVEAVAARLQKERPPSDVRIEEVDKPVAVQPATTH
jgi:membrane dipeptidase